ncbi:hypothetical protein [Cryptosporangium minutisporangium]|uniref:hypothetical protein n=1 Tax=Cryptosporangium minutisporangium TaxID=113569 RepID=UPI0035E58DE0
MKAYTSRERFDERRRFTGVRERMGQVRLDSEANEQTVLARTDARRRSADLAEGSPDDGFAIGDAHLIDPITTLDGWSAEGLPADDERVIPRLLRLARRDPETLPHVVRTRGHVAVLHRLPNPLDLLRLPVPLDPAGATYGVAALRVRVRFERPPTDDELVDVRVVVLDREGTEHEVADVSLPEVSVAATDWTTVRIPRAALDPLGGTVDGRNQLLLAGWGLRGLPPRAETDLDALLAEDGGLGDGDLVIRGGDGTLAGAGRLYAGGLRTFLEHDWRYSRQPDLPDPPPLERPPLDADGEPAGHHLVYADIWERTWHRFQDRFLAEDALPGEETAFRTRKVTQVRVLPVPSDDTETLPPALGTARLTTNVPAGQLPDRFPAEQPDPCRDRCLFTENATIGEGYTGTRNVHVRVEAIATHGDRPVIAWSRENASLLAPLVQPAGAGAATVHVDPDDAKYLVAGDVVVIEDERSRLDGERPQCRAVLRRLAAVDTATGELELEGAGHTLTTDPAPLVAGGGLDRAFALADAPAVRRWDGADWLLADVRYNLADGIVFAMTGTGLRLSEYWSFVARVTSPDGAATGVVEQLTAAPVQGPAHLRVPLARVRWTPGSRSFEDVRQRFLPLHDVRDRLAELGRRNLSPGAFTVVVGDGVRTFGDIDQNLSEGVTGDEALQAALDRLGPDGGTVYLRAGTYRLEHPVLVRGRSRIRLLGDGAATRVEITGAGGAFFLDWCGADGEVSVERMELIESAAPQVPVGVDVLAPELPGAPGGDTTVRPLVPSDLSPISSTTVDLLGGFAARLRAIRPFEGRGAEAVVATVAQLRRLQRAHPGRPLDEIAPDELAVLRTLPHGVVTVADCRQVRLTGLTVTSREAGLAGVVNAAVLVAGACAGISVTESRLRAPSGVVAAPYGRSLTPESLVLWPRSGLFVRGLTISGNEITAAGSAADGVRVADGVVDGLTIEGNRIEGFARGIALQDRAETRAGEPVDASVVTGNLVTGCREVGILIAGDGVDAAANEVRVAEPDGPRDGLTAGIQVTGAQNRVRDSWITLPRASTPLPFALQAGIVIGSGLVAQRLVAGADPVVPRPVHDVEIAGNRVEGPGSLATGILIGGAQAAFDVRVRGNTLRDLGDAGIRAWGYGGAVGGVRIEDNDVEATALGYLSWGPDAVAQLAARSGVALPGGAGPQEALATLLAAPGDLDAALDDVLRWLERATLRGGIVLSLVEESAVRDNRVADIGTRTLPPGFGGPGVEIRTAGVATVGGRDLVVAGNRVQRILAPVEVTSVGPPATPPIRPPVFDVLESASVAVQPGRSVGTDSYGASVALRRLVMEYAQGNASVRQRLGGRIYTAMESVAAAMEGGGAEGRRLALELTGGIGEMLAAQSGEEHTRTATHVRATLSLAAARSAGAEETTRAWEAAARFDGAMLGSFEEVVAAATDVVSEADALTQGLEALELRLGERAQAVVAATGSPAARTAARLALAAALGTVAEARGQRLSYQQAAAGGALSETDRTVAEGIVRLSLDALDVPQPDQLNAETIAGLERGSTALAEVLQAAHRALADRVRDDFDLLRATPGRPTRADVDRFVATLTAARTVAAGAVDAIVVRPDDVAAQQARFQAELVTLTSDQLERRVAGLALDTPSAATRNLRLLGQSAGQLINLVGADPELAGPARAVRQALAQAVTDPDRRTEHTAEARRHLRDLQRVQARKAGIAVTDPAPDAGPAAVDQQQLAALAEVLLVLRDVREPDLRTEGVRLFEDTLRRQIDAAGIRGSEREGLLGTLPSALAALASDSGPDAAVAAHTLAGAVEQVGLRAAQAPTAAPDVHTTYVLTGAVTRALDPAADDADRLTTVGRWVRGNQKSLSNSLSGAVTAAPGLNTALGVVRGGLAGVTGVPIISRPPLGVRLVVDAHPADALYAAGVQQGLGVRGNELADAHTGVTVVGAAAHPLAPLGAAPAAVAVDDNQVSGAAVAALDLGPDGTAELSVSGNSATNCAGAGPESAAERGQAVVRVVGSGAAVVVDNRLHGNGNRRSGGPLHEVLLDWRGDVLVRGNRIRHTGGERGGVAIAVLIDEVPAALLGDLSLKAALDVEPLSKTAPFPGDLPNRPLDGLNDLVAAGLGGGAFLAGTHTFGVGAFRLSTRVLQPGIDVLATGAAAALPGGAVQAADGWLARTAPVRFEPLVEFLLRLPPLDDFPQPTPRRAVQVAGNDVVAGGPALLVLAQQSLVSASVVGNELASSTATGAVYLRGIDTTVFSANRCECLGLPNVVVLRCGRSLVTVQGNVAAGAEPPTPTTPPFIPEFPLPTSFGDLTLQVKVGPAATMNLRLDERAVAEALDARTGTAFSEVSTDAEASFNLFAKRQDLPAAPDIARVLTFGARDELIRFGKGPGGPIIERPRPSGPVGPVGPLDPGPLGPIGRPRPTPTLPTRPDLGRPEVPPPERPQLPTPSDAEDPTDEADVPEAAPQTEVPDDVIERAVLVSNTILTSVELPSAAKLYGMAVSAGLAPHQARALVQTQLVRAGGNQTAALAGGLESLTGVAEVGPTVTEQVEAAHPVEGLLSLLLRNRRFTPVEPPLTGPSVIGPSTGPSVIAAPPPDPKRHSLVVIGGSRVGAVGNVTTAGVHLHDAGQSIENNL